MKAKNKNGTVVIYSTLPTYYVLNGTPINLHSLAQNPANLSTIEAEGFYDVVVPSITVYQRLEPLIPTDFDTPSKTWIQRVYDFTAQEIIDYDNQVIDNAIDSNFNQQETNGQDAARALRRYIQRQFNDAVITETQYENIEDSLTPVHNWLQRGRVQRAKNYFNSGHADYITPPGDADLLDIYNFIKNKVNAL
jgi:hypothetical protein